MGVTGLVSLGPCGLLRPRRLCAGASSRRNTQRRACGAPCRWPCGVSALAALVIGFFVVRTHGIYFIMVTLAFAQMVFFLFFDNKIAGRLGRHLHQLQADATSAWQPFDLDNIRHVFYYFTLAMLRAGLRVPAPAAVQPVRPRARRHPRQRAPHARSASAPSATSSPRFTLAGALAGLAGYLWGAQTGFVNPELMGLHLSRARAS